MTSEQMRQHFVSLGIPTDGVDFAKLAEVDAGILDVPGWEAPRVLPASWREVKRVPDGAQYFHAEARLSCILSCAFETDGRAWLHLSVKHQTRIPTWGELRICKEQFLGDREAVQILPPKAKYINIHTHVLHLFALLSPTAPTGLPDFTNGTGSI